ncbi:hypothetical protein, partial [uncultured Cetobacterium sp.]|uniref:hypothetical protein n=1 Tax=uncultured Cetobacterium sp. TaxID=527638 RepID=UPI0026215BF2
MNIIDNIIDIKTKDAKGNDIFAFDKKRSTITASVENNSSSGIFNPQGNLNARDVMIAPNESVVYIIKLFTNESIVGEIKNNAKVIDRNGDEKESNTVILTSEPYKLQLNKKAVSDVKYMPGEQISFDISVKNIGKGIYYNGIITDKIDELKSMLANSSLGSSSEDVLESPVSQWNISAKLGGESEKSESNLILNGGEENNKGLNDTNVIIYPQEEIEYSVNITTKKTAISKIENTAKVEDLKSTAFYEPQELAKLKDISIIKTTNQSEYEPGDNIIYKIVVRNNNGLKFANNINITDNLSSILATQIDGNKELAFENWKLEVVKTEGVGTASGDFPYGELQSSNKNLKITADIASGGEIEYKLIAKVKATTIGVIIDSSKDDDVAEKGTGVKMAPPKLGIIKEVNSTEYTPGSDLIYKITIDNTGKGIAVNIPVKDIFSNIKTDLVTGEKGEAYIGTEVTGVILNNDGTINTEKPDFIGFNGTLVNEDLNTNIILSPDKKIVYTVKAKINNLASGKIMNIASVNGELVSDKGAVTKIKNIILEKNVDKQLYPNNVGKNGLITEPEKITYTIKISNRADSGFAMNIPVIDKISHITGETLSGNIVNVFTNGWNITTNCVGVGTKVSGNKIENNKDINTKVNIAPDGYIEIKVSGDVYRDGEDILYGSFSNSVESGTLSKKVTTNPKKPFLKVFKGTKEPVYADGGYITYSIIVENVGEGYANNAKIEDNILNIKDKNGKKVFASWEITSSTTGNGTKALPIKNNENIDSTMDIAPNGGKIIYTVKGKLNTGLEGSITNEVVVTDMQTSNKITASATQDKASNTGTLYIRKTTETSSINPLDKFTYIISVVNNSEKKLEGITVKDDLNKIIGNLANENGKNIEDLKGKVFSSWDIYKGNIKINTQANEILNDNIDHLDKHGVINYKIIAIPNKKVLQQKIKNIAYIYKNDKIIEKSSVENIVLGSNGGTTRSVNLSKYKPGDILIYKIKISPQDVGYLNNYHINENINDLNVNLMNGTKGNVFFNPLTNRNEYSVSFIENESKVSSGTVVIPESHIKNNENLQGVVDVAQGDYLVYEIKGKIRPDIIGDINYKGVITTGYRHNLTVTKKVENRSYIPGKSLTYVLRVENNSNGNAGQISLIDDLEKVMVENSEGVNEGAFKKDTTKIINITKGGYGASAPMPKNLNSIKTLIDVPVGGFIQYKISIVVNDKAVGNIVNLLNVDGDTVSSGIRLPQGKIRIEKTMGNYYDTDGVTVVKEGYVPGGYVDYTIRLTNIS